MSLDILSYLQLMAQNGGNQLLKIWQEYILAVSHKCPIAALRPCSVTTLLLRQPQTSLHFFVLTQKNEAKKSQDCARFARKISAQTAKSSKLATPLLRQGRFLTLFSLIFRLIGQGQSLSSPSRTPDPGTR